LGVTNNSDKSDPPFENQARGWDPSAAPTETIPAATAILLRPGDPFEVLMLRRNSKLAFVGGMWVFPGGRVDPGDTEGAASELEAAKRAAARETEEEAGLRIDPDHLAPFAHWMPPAGTPRRFSTWFFAGAAPDGDVSIDGGEIHDHLWKTPEEVLALRDGGEIEMAPPTFVTLSRLARSGSMNEALAELDAGDVEYFETRIVDIDGTLTALWAGDASYDAATREALSANGFQEQPGARHRLEMRTGAWSYQRE
jgi:8-oxo-dGTP pyrophosphatase MutT (NUDIX family)